MKATAPQTPITPPKTPQSTRRQSPPRISTPPPVSNPKHTLPNAPTRNTTAPKPAAPQAAAPKPAAPKPTNPHHELGRKGEDLAVSYLSQQGLVLLDRNWRCKEGELDLILTDGAMVVVCEVKTRAGKGFGEPEDAVDDRKARRIRRLTNIWLSSFRIPWCELRFDILAITWPPHSKPHITHIRDAF